MQIKNKVKKLIILILLSFVCNINVLADEFNIVASEILLDKENNIITGKGSVEVTDNKGKIIKADNVVYEKSKELLKFDGSVEFLDVEGNILKTDKATYDKNREIITTYENSKLEIKEGYTLTSNKIIYLTIEKRISSDLNSSLKDQDGNLVTVSMFEYQLQKNLFSSIGKIQILDTNNNKYYFKEIHVDTKKKEMIGSDVSVVLDQENFGLTKKFDPRFVSNDIYISKNKSNFQKGVFTVCKNREGKCPPWSLQAKKISHDKAKKTIYYDHATLKFYDIPIFYFPKFFHPDPTVKRQSGFLTPFFTKSTTVGTGFGLPYYWAINKNKDLTFTPKIYANENVLLLNEYRQAFKNGFLTLDTSYTEGYKDSSTTKTTGSRNHIFAEFDVNLSENESYESALSLKIQRTSNDTYFRIHDINTALAKKENTNLENKITYSFSKDDTYLDISSTVYEDLRKKDNSRYEYILPNVLFGKSFFTEKFGTLDFKSNAYHKNYNTNKTLSILTNDIVWSPGSYITPKGFVNSLEGFIKNTNYDAKKTTDYKNTGMINEISSALSFKSSFPMKKETSRYSKIFSPNYMVRFAPGHMRNLSGDDIALNYNNLFSTNKTSVIEDGLSTVLGFNYVVNEKNEQGKEREKLSLSMGQIFNLEENKNLPAKSSLDQKMSDVVGELKYNFSKIGSIDYKFSIDHNLNQFNYNEIASTFNFGKVDFNLDYLEERSHIGSEHYISSGVTLNVNDNNKLSFGTKKNYKTSSTEFYDLQYQYEIDCLTAGLVYRREFYEDSDVEQKDSLMFVIKFIPFTGVTTPSFINP